jgi:uncharacterized protein YggE
MNSINKNITKNSLASSATLFIGSIIIAMPSAVWAASISVSGDAQIRVAPDQIIISMGVLNKEKTLDTAKKLNDKTTKSLISYLTDTLKHGRLGRTFFCETQHDHVINYSNV